MPRCENSISTRVANCTRMPPAALLVEPAPTASRSSTTTSRAPRRPRWYAMLAPMAPAPITTMSAARGIAGLTVAAGRTTARSIEALAEPVLHVALVLVHAALGRGLQVDLLPQDLRHRGQPGHVGPALPVPETGALEGLRAVQEALLDLDADGHLGPLPLHLQPGQDLRVADDAR